ncbi:MAG: hypothetical protein GTN69_14020, partial [Armatimonadetes bacterium]|nr:hypothetical protein [Armatimonadota bacterium]NIO76955.1 hypothetical protein [Armatimonadota bacterium]NIO97249.1 hypothetical protein [Armatimonadota bacterium]
MLLSRCRREKPAGLNHYLGTEGYQALEKALAAGSAQVIAEVETSALLGRGGAEFPTGMKWKFTAQQEEMPKFIVCNADEGEPGTFKDKLLLDRDPHRIIEGMAIAGFAVGAEKGFLYVKGEYKDTLKSLHEAIAEAKKSGYLGQDILGSSFHFSIELRAGAGSYIVGEETALLESIEGKRGITRSKPPFPTQYGLFGKPTVINNVETLANIPDIILKGGAWYKSLGVEGASGTKLFSLSGMVKKPGIYELELGKRSLRDLICRLGEGMEGERRLKAVLPGGASTGFLTEEHLDIILDFASVKQAGSSLGSGGVLVFDESVSIPALVKHLFEFYLDESCGRCAPCRIGTKRISEALERLLSHKASHADLEQMKSLAEFMQISAACGLGSASPNPLLSSLRLFAGEYEALLKG